MSTVLMTQLRGSLEAEDRPRRNGKYVTCSVCGGSRYRRLSRIAKTPFCSRTCRYAYGKRLGIVKLKPAEDRFWEKVKRTDGCWLWEGAITGRGYGAINDQGKMVIASRFAYKLYHGADLTPGQRVCHTCDNRACVRKEHLFLGTDLDNARDRDRKGRGAKGERSGKNKLTAANVLEIRSSPLMLRELGLKFGVKTATVCAIRKRRIWREI